MAKNSYFRFKQFTIHQDRSAMKVCTDACVLGAWTDLPIRGRLLDIGAGTGLLSLMAAQRNENLQVDAVELDQDAWMQAMENVSESPFVNRISVFNEAIQTFEPGYQYDGILTNPPFFQSDLRSPNAKKNQAHHASTLTFDELLTAIDRLLLPAGRFHILLPTDEGTVFCQKAQSLGWSMEVKLILKHNKNKKPFRVLMTFARVYCAVNQLNEGELSVYNEDDLGHDPVFRELMKPFYMIF